MGYINLKNISFGYSKKNQLFTNLSLSFELGEQIAIIGRNGSGKTTLVKLIIGMLKPIDGQIEISNENIEKKSISDIASKVGFVFQNPNQMLFTNAVEKELELSLRKFNLPNEIKEQKINSILEFLDIVELKDSNPRILSRGEKQKIALATVLIQNPHAIILDEPFSGIDMTQRLKIIDYLNELHKQGKLIILITHNLDFVLNYSSRVIGLKNGQLISDSLTIDFFNNQDNLLKLDLDKSNYLSLIYNLRKCGLPSRIIKTQQLISFFKNSHS
ncbi:MAG: ABC transporter ATP-binding protein [Asgard group archaeon]|nr:ABC transporter ATP-binding protein [Asgard group archaeon]